MNLPAPAVAILPRLLRLRDAPAYLGMDRNRFGAEVRPFVTTIPIGRQGIAFDRPELDAWVEEYMSRNGRPGRLQGERLWDVVGDRRASASGAAFGTSTNGSKGEEFAKALAQINWPKRNGTSHD